MMDNNSTPMEQEKQPPQLLIHKQSSKESQESEIVICEDDDNGDEDNNGADYVKVYECGICHAGYFRTGAALANHLSFVHGKKEKLTCDVCNIKFPHKKDLICHKNVHKMEDKGNFLCPICSKRFHRTNLVMDHLSKIHVGSVETENILFPSLSEFLDWKEQIELKTKSSFINFRGTTKNKKGISVYYVCHRNGRYIPRGNQKRALKKSGSNKINGFCPARMFVKTVGDEVRVKFTKTHYGHSMDLERVALSKREKNEIANKIAMKVPFNEILDEIKDSLSCESLSRKHLITKKDLYNIATSYNLGKSSLKPKSEILTFDDWIVELEKKYLNSVKLYKSSGTILSDFPQLNSDDFTLIVASESQLSLLEAYANEFVCIDWISSENLTGIHLFPILITDETNDAYPVACLFTNRVDSDVLEIYFSIINNCLKFELSPKYFMSDVDDFFFKSWCAVVNTWQKTQKLYCSWLLDSHWRNALTRIQEKEKQAAIYKNVKMIMSQVNESLFNIMCNNFVQFLLNDTDTAEFSDYFSNFLLQHPTPWASCYRPELIVNVNVALENTHKVLKNLFLCEGTERGLQAVVNYSIDRLKEKTQEINKGDTDSKKLLGILKRHVASLKLSTDLVTCSGPGVWKVISAKSSNEMCEVSISDPTCECSLKCPECEICIHYYKCNCVSAVKASSCKHMHLIARMIKEDIGLLEAEEIELEAESLPLQEIPGFENTEFLFTTSDAGHVAENSEDLNSKIIICKTEPEDSPELFLARKNSIKEKILELIDNLESIEEIDCVENILEPVEKAVSNIRKSRTFEVIVSMN